MKVSGVVVLGNYIKDLMTSTLKMVKYHLAAKNVVNIFVKDAPAIFLTFMAPTHLGNLLE
jgi:hypothetical protein